MQQYNTDTDRVAALIDSYRETIGGVNSMNVKAIQDFIEAEEKKVYETVEKRITSGEDVRNLDKDIYIPSDLENRIKVNEQLLGYFYMKAAGKSVEKEVLSQLFVDYYDRSFFSEEEESFLLIHFKELTNYIIKTSYLAFREYDDLKDAHLIPSEIIDIINQTIEIPYDATVYNPFAGFAQFATLFNRNHFICEESYTVGRERCRTDNANWLWAWMKIALFANNRNAVVIDACEMPSSYDYAISYIPFTSVDFFINPNEDTLKDIHQNSCDTEIVSRIQSTYQNLTNKGKMVLVIPEYCLREMDGNCPLADFWEQLISDGSLTEIIQLPSTCNGLNYSFCLLTIQKDCKSNSVTLIDARFAAKKNSNVKIIELEDYIDVIRENGKRTDDSNSSGSYRGVFIEGEEKMVEEFDSPYFQTIDLDLFYSMLHNNGRDSITGLRKKVTINRNDLNQNMLLPQVYVIEKPQNVASSITLSALCTYVSTIIREWKYDLPMDTPWIMGRDLTYTYQGPLEIFDVEKADCPNIPPHTDDFSFNEYGVFSEERPWSQCKPLGRRVIKYRKSTYLDANKDAVLLKMDTSGNPFAVVVAQDKPIAVDKDVMVFCPNNGVQVVTLAAILKMPIVYNQVLAYKRFGLENHLDDIIVPYDKWLIDNEVSRLLHEEEMANIVRTDYKNIKKSVRMRKHALTQTMSSIGAMFNALNAYRKRKGGIITNEEVISRVKGTTVNEAFDYLSKSIKSMMPVLEHIADVEYTFEKPEWIDPEAFIENYISKNETGWINFKSVITWENGHNKATNDIVDRFTRSVIFRRGEILTQFQFPKDALAKILDNIISNAQSHGFVKPHANYKIKFSWYIEDKTVKILIENNGSPIPDDMDPSSLLEYGVSTVLHSDGHNGIGCNEIDDIMRRYDGKVDIISSPEEEYTVKYLLTFFRSNSVY